MGLWTTPPGGLGLADEGEKIIKGSEFNSPLGGKPPSAGNSQNMERSRDLPRASWAQAFRSRLSESATLGPVLGAGLALLLGVVVLSSASDVFLTQRNLTNVATAASVFVILGVGQALVMNTAGIDVSIGSIVGLTSTVLGGMIIGAGTGVVTGIVATLGAGLLAGLFNGLVIVYLKIPPIIATLGTLTAFRGLAFVIQGAEIYHSFPEQLLFIGRGRLLDVPLPILIGVAVSIWGAYFVKRTKMGRGMTAIGGSEESARIAGVPVNRYRITVYAIMGTLASLAGIVSAGRLDAATASSGTMWELHTIALVVIGGTALFGGRVSITGVVIGSLILSVLENGLLLLGFDSFLQRVFLGLVVIVAVGLRTYKNKSPMMG